MKKAEEFSIQVLKEKQDNPENSLIECVETIRSTHGLEPTEVPKLLTQNLKDLIYKESIKANVVLDDSNEMEIDFFK